MLYARILSRWINDICAKVISSGPFYVSPWYLYQGYTLRFIPGQSWISVSRLYPQLLFRLVSDICVKSGQFLIFVSELYLQVLSMSVIDMWIRIIPSGPFLVSPWYLCYGYTTWFFLRHFLISVTWLYLQVHSLSVLYIWVHVIASGPFQVIPWYLCHGYILRSFPCQSLISVSVYFLFRQLHLLCETNHYIR